jgi:hypothetical protein
MIYEVYIDGTWYDDVEATDSADACRQVFDRLDGHVGREMSAELLDVE